MEKQGHSLLAVCVSIPKALSLSLSAACGLSQQSAFRGEIKGGDSVITCSVSHLLPDI